MAETTVINMGKVPGKWLKLMLHFQNTTTGVFRCVFPDNQTAKKSAHCMTSTMEKHPNWFTMVVCQRGCDVYLIRKEHAQKVVIKDELP